MMLLVGLAAGAAAGFLLMRLRARAAAGSEVGRVEELRAQLAEECRRAATLQSQAVGAEGERRDALARADEMAKRLEEEKALLADAQQRLSDAFKSLAAQALSQNNQ